MHQKFIRVVMHKDIHEHAPLVAVKRPNNLMWKQEVMINSFTSIARTVLIVLKWCHLLSF